MKYILALFICLSSTLTLAQKAPKNSVIFGEHVEKISYDIEKEYHIHMDQNGDYYPNIKISDDDLKNQGKSQLRVWAKEFPDDFESIAQAYNLEQSIYSNENFETLQDSIVADITKSINKYSKEKYQTWLIHGFRKNLYQPDNYVQTTSFLDNAKAKNVTNSYLNSGPSKETYYVEVYWDGKYAHYTGKKSLIKLAKLFKKAIPNAKQCGYSLRDIFDNLVHDEINIITHSTGTHTGVSILYNVQKNFNYSKPTPDNKINLVLVASASSGKKLFKNYYKRNTTSNFKAADNYRIINVYNENDKVLKSNLYFPSRASTKLGCNFKNESGKLLKFFEKEYLNSKYIEIEVTYSGGAEHRLINYMSDSNFKQAFQLIYH